MKIHIVLTIGTHLSGEIRKWNVLLATRIFLWKSFKEVDNQNSPEKIVMNNMFMLNSTTYCMTGRR